MKNNKFDKDEPVVSKRCKICKNPNHFEVEKKVFDKEYTYEQASKELGCSVSSFSKHINKHVKIPEKVREKYRESETTKRKNEIKKEIAQDEIYKYHTGTVNEFLTDLVKLDYMVESGFELRNKLIKQLIISIDNDEEMSHKDKINLINNIDKNTNTTLNTKLKILGMDGESKQADALNDWISLMGELDD